MNHPIHPQIIRLQLIGLAVARKDRHGGEIGIQLKKVGKGRERGGRERTGIISADDFKVVQKSTESDAEGEEERPEKEE